eukprot:m.39584 g.39584  ORF g.39584 m.39584 type:complete len:69 (+) comp11625_c0_seq1:970-1176(+)
MLSRKQNQPKAIEGLDNPREGRNYEKILPSLLSAALLTGSAPFQSTSTCSACQVRVHPATTHLTAAGF